MTLGFNVLYRRLLGIQLSLYHCRSYSSADSRDTDAVIINLTVARFKSFYYRRSLLQISLAASGSNFKKLNEDNVKKIIIKKVFIISMHI